MGQHGPHRYPERQRHPLHDLRLGGDGVADLSPFDKVVIASHPPSFYAALSANVAYFESYLQDGGGGQPGGILEFHGASFFADDWSGMPMPAGLTIAPQGDANGDDALTIVDAGHPLVTTPNVIDNDEVDGWGFSTHSFFTGAGAPFDTVIEEDEFGQPVLIELSFGDGCVIATMMTLEWFGANPEVLENALLRTCQVVPVELQRVTVE